jgi:hypothetical protein
MKPRASETSIIAVGLLLFVALSLYFISRSTPTKPTYPALSSFSPKPDGALALYDLLGQSGLQVERNLSGQYHYPEGGCVVRLDESLIDAAALMGGGMDARAVSQWMRRGGRLVLFSSPLGYETTQFFEELEAQAEDGKLGGTNAAPAGSQPDKAADIAQATPEPAHASHSGSGEAGASYAPVRLARPGGVYDLDQPVPALFRGVKQIEIAAPDYAALDSGATLLAADSPPLKVVSWLPVGKGELLWVTVPELTSNAWIDRADNHRLLLNLFEYAARGKPVVFDEFVHGYRERGSSATGLIFQSRGGQLLLVLLGLCALAFAGAAVSPARFMPPPVPPRRQAQEMVLAQANLYERARLRQGVARHLLDGLRQAVRQHEHWITPPDDVRLTHWLQAAVTRGLPVDQALLKVLAGQQVIGTPQQLLRFAQACDKLRARLG